MRKAYVFKERQRYSIRKYSFGAASVLIGTSLMLGGHTLAQEQANSTGSITDYEVTVNNSEAPQIDQATSEAVTDVLNQPASRSEAPRPKLASSEVASSEASSVVASETASLEVPAEVAHSASAVASVASSEVASPRSEVSSVASSEVASETDRSAMSEAVEVRPTDREAVDTSLRTVLTNASQPGVDGPVTADGSLDIPSNGTFYFRRTTEIRTAPVMDIKPTFVFSAGDHVIYDKVLKRDDHQWISYIGYDYERYYADIAALKAENTSTTEATRDEAVPERGTYYFTKPADVKNQPSLTAKTEFNFDPGMSVNYDRSLLADNHRWISYTSYSGTRRYVDLGAVAEAVAKPRGDIAIESHDNGDFSVVISNVSDQNGVLGVSVPIWSEKNGQDDIIWYNATRLNNGNYKVNVSLTDHKNERGLYNVHLYYVETNGKLVGVGGTAYTVPAKVEETHTTTSYSLPDSGTYTFKERTGIKAEPRVASPELAYYDAGMSVNYDKIVSGDGYQWLSYLSYNGNRRYVAVAKLAQQESKPSGTINIENLSNLGFDVHITNVSGGDKAIQSVSVPVWTAKDGQDDIRWYEAARQANGDYKVSVKASDHKNSTGLYYVHLYYIQNDGSRVGVLASSTEVEFRNANTKTRAFIKNVNVEAGTYTVEVDQAPQGRHIKNVRVAAWSQDHQENLYWYSATPTGMHTEITVSANNHGNEAGNYTTHVYVDYVDGGVEGFNLGQTALNPRGTTGQTGLSPRVDSGQRDRVLRAAASLVGVRGGSAAHQQLVNDYNSVRPLPVGYAVKNTDDWCDVFVTTIFQREGLSDLVGRECGVERHIQIFKRLGIWNEDGGSTPKAGDIITFNWDQDSQPNNGFADHIGIVESVSNGVIHTIEGNSNDQVRRKTYRIGHGNIRGFASPRYQ